MMEVEALIDGVITALHAAGVDGIAVGTAIADMQGDEASDLASSGSEYLPLLRRHPSKAEPTVSSPSAPVVASTADGQYGITTVKRCVMPWQKKCAVMNMFF